MKNIFLLDYIEKNRTHGKNFYALRTQTGNVDVSNEKSYDGCVFPSKRLRILNLFRYWNIVEYFFPYKYQMDINWDTTLFYTIPHFLSVNDTVDYHMAWLELIAKLNDSHAFFASKYTFEYYGEKWAPVATKIIEDKVVITSYYDQSLAIENDLRIGDIILKVDNVKIQDLVDQNMKYVAASNQAVKKRDICKYLLNGSTESTVLEILRDNNKLMRKIKRYEFGYFKNEKEKSYPNSWRIIEKNIGYVNMGNVKLNEVSKIMNNLLHSQSIIFDLRNYPNGTMYEFASWFLNKPVPFAYFTEPDFTYPGRFVRTQPYYCGKRQDDTTKIFHGDVILLINELTQSHAEFNAMCFQTFPNCTVIGSQTAGADGNISKIKFLYTFETYMSGIGVYYPDGRETQRCGIIPDIVVEPTILGVKYGRDELLLYALKFLREKVNIMKPVRVSMTITDIDPNCSAYFRGN
ncbi:MAG: hypothetical protein IPM74_02110 [Crocinitomicaceae bacterium]|nr:hypothetical protein [Crocinitomicaceae bacterium]